MWSKRKPDDFALAFFQVGEIALCLHANGCVRFNRTREMDDVKQRKKNYFLIDEDYFNLTMNT